MTSFLCLFLLFQAVFFKEVVSVALVFRSNRFLTARSPRHLMAFGHQKCRTQYIGLSFKSYTSGYPTPHHRFCPQVSRKSKEKVASHSILVSLLTILFGESSQRLLAPKRRGTLEEQLIVIICCYCLSPVCLAWSDVNLSRGRRTLEASEQFSHQDEWQVCRQLRRFLFLPWSFEESLSHPHSRPLHYHASLVCPPLSSSPRLDAFLRCERETLHFSRK